MSEARARVGAGRVSGRSVGVVGLALVGLLLSGCGSLGIHPGSAAVVGSDTVSMSKVDSTASLYCQGLASTIQTSQTSQIPMHGIRQLAAIGLASQLLGQGLAAHYGVGPGSGYAQAMTQLKQQIPAMSADQKRAVLEVEGGFRYLQWVQVAVGQKLLAESGQSTGDVKAALQRGQVATQDWLKSHPISIDPVFGVKADGGQFKSVQDQTSYPLSALASMGAAGTTTQPDPSYTAALTPAERCG